MRYARKVSTGEKSENRFYKGKGKVAIETLDFFSPGQVKGCQMRSQYRVRVVVGGMMCPGQ